MGADVMGHIVITRTPRGEAPEQVRAAWVGCTIPCEYIAGGPCDGVVSGELEENFLGYLVKQMAALEVLERRSPDAAQWWHDHGYPQSPVKFFSFRLDEAEKIGEIKVIPVQVADDMEMGFSEFPGR